MMTTTMMMVMMTMGEDGDLVGFMTKW